MKIKLYVNLYQTGNSARDKELYLCFDRNLNSGLFASVVNVPGRPTFNDFFEATREHGQGHINIIANSDIFFDGTIGLLRDYYRKGGTSAMALSRWDVTAINPIEAHLHAHKDSQDAWVFPDAVQEMEGADFALGVPGCDNRIARIMQDNGYNVINPSWTVKAYHYHLSGYRSYGEGRGKPKAHTVPGPYAFVEPTELIKL